MKTRLSCDVGQEPQGVARHGEQAHVREQHGWAFPELELVDRSGHVLAAHEVEPYLNIALELELRGLALRREEDVEVELVSVGVERYALDDLWHLAGVHDHAREATHRGWGLTRTFRRLPQHRQSHRARHAALLEPVDHVAGKGLATTQTSEASFLFPLLNMEGLLMN